MRVSRFGLMLLAAATVAGTAAAGGGVLEINEVCAVQTGCFPGDAAGYPVTIAQAGSYRLTGNLPVPDGDTTAIAIAAGVSQVTLDLGGFAIVGPNVIVAGACSHPGVGRGIDAPGDISDLGIAVIDGSVVGMGSHGVLLAGQVSRAERIVAARNCGDGIRVDGDGGTIVASHGRGNKGAGLSASALIRDSFASNNDGAGIQITGIGSVVTGNVSRENAVGILLTSSTRPAVVAYNTVTGNRGDAVSGGIVTLIHNTLYDNDGLSYSGDAASGVGENTFRTNAGGASGVSIGCNVLEGVPFCPSHP